MDLKKILIKNVRASLFWVCSRYEVVQTGFQDFVESLATQSVLP